MQVAITGSSGLIGTALRRALVTTGHEAIRIVRAGPPGADVIRWDPAGGALDAHGLEGIDAVVHLAGASIGGGRWTATQKRSILESRVRGTSLLAATLASLQNAPRVFVSGSAVGYYGDRGDEPLTEESPPGTGFLAEVTRRWEEAAEPAERAGIRVACIRTGIVLSRTGGALKKMLLPFKLGLGGRVGSGRQFWSWISIRDEVGAILHLMQSDEVSGPVNLTAPHPTSQAEFAATLARVLSRPAVLPTPTVALRALYGRAMVQETLLWGQRVLPHVLDASGYRFAHPTLEAALRAVVSDAA